MCSYCIKIVIADVTTEARNLCVMSGRLCVYKNIRMCKCFLIETIEI